MSWFAKPVKAVETAPQVTPLEQLHEVEGAFRANEIAFNAACAAFRAHPLPTYRVRIGDTTNIQTERPTPESKRILAAVRETTARRDALLLERALLRRAMGL
jgi:hypothetical protein